MTIIIKVKAGCCRTWPCAVLAEPRSLSVGVRAVWADWWRPVVSGQRV